MAEQFLEQVTKPSRHWQELELGYIASIHTGCQYVQYEWPMDDLQPCTVIDRIEGELITLDGPRYIRITEREKVKFMLREGDIIFKNRTSPNQLGHCALFTRDEPVIHTKHLRIRPENGCEGTFLQYMLNMLRSTGKLHQIATVNKKLACILVDDLKKLRIPCPPLDVQQQWLADCQVMG